MTDDATVIFFAGRQSRLGRGKARSRELEAGLRLRNVGARQVADFKTVVGCLQIGVEDADLVLVQLDDRPVSDDVHVGRNSFGEDIAFDRAKRCAARFDAGVRRADRVTDRPAVEQRVADIHAAAERWALALARVQDSTSREVAVDTHRARNLWSSCCAGNCHRGIRRAQRFALGHDGRVCLVGRNERIAQRVG
jgi:hypothetical protein